MLKANWMSAIAHPCALFIGPTNNVQPYCRLAIITMQTIPTSSWTQRSVPGVLAATALAYVMFALLPRDDLHFCREFVP